MQYKTYFYDHLAICKGYFQSGVLPVNFPSDKCGIAYVFCFVHVSCLFVYSYFLFCFSYLCLMFLFISIKTDSDIDLFNCFKCSVLFYFMGCTDGLGYRLRLSYSFCLIHSVCSIHFECGKVLPYSAFISYPFTFECV